MEPESVPTSPTERDSSPTLAEALDEAGRRLGRLEARLLLQEATGFGTSTLIAHPERSLTAAQHAHFQALVARREAGEPVAYLIGRREFYGHEFQVAPGVLIPRPETELLVDLGIAELAEWAERVRHTDMTHADEAGRQTPLRALDLGCGSGCIAVSLALACPTAEVWALDASPTALEITQRNARALGARLTLRLSDWFAALSTDSVTGESERFHLILSNPPYIAADDAHLAQGDLRFEPLTALASGADGLEAIRHLIAAAPAHLHPGGWLHLEHGHDQGPALPELLQAAGYADIQQQRDLAGIVRVSGGRWPG